MCIHTYMHACMHACMHTYIQTNKQTYIHTYIHTYTNVCTCICKYNLKLLSQPLSLAQPGYMVGLLMGTRYGCLGWEMNPLGLSKIGVCTCFRFKQWGYKCVNYIHRYINAIIYTLEFVGHSLLRPTQSGNWYRLIISAMFTVVTSGWPT